jgi:hypothetical protein
MYIFCSRREGGRGLVPLSGTLNRKVTLEAEVVDVSQEIAELATLREPTSFNIGIETCPEPQWRVIVEHFH